MKSIYHIIFGTILSLLVLTSCETDLNPTDTGHYELNASFVFPAGAAGDYRVVFVSGEDTVKNGGLIPKNEAERQLQVYDNTNELVFSQDLQIQGDQNIQLIELPGKGIDVYSPEKYTAFTFTIVNYNSAYTARFNGQDLLVNAKNYVLSDGLSGNLQIFREGESEPVFSQETTIEPDGKLNLMRLDTEFLAVPEDGEPPATNNLAKTRFFYTDDNLPASMRIDIFFAPSSWDRKSELPLAQSVTVQKGVLSPYVELDMSAIEGRATIYCSVFDLIDNKYISEYLKDKRFMVGLENGSTDTSNYKFATYQIIPGSSLNLVRFSVMEALSTKW